jgi:ankyrin repeat protein
MGRDVRPFFEKGYKVDPQDAGQALGIAASFADMRALPALLQQGLDVNAKNNDGWNALLIASNYHIERPDIVGFILQRKADTEARTPNQETALILAAKNGSANAVKLLLERGADKAAKDSVGRTALDYARFNHRKDIVALLKQARKPRVSNGEIRKLAVSLARELKNIRHSESRYNEERYYAAQHLSDAGATEAQIKLYYKISDTIPNPDGSFNSNSGNGN